MLTALSRLTMIARGVTATTGYAVPLTPDTRESHQKAVGSAEFELCMSTRSQNIWPGIVELAATGQRLARGNHRICLCWLNFGQARGSHSIRLSCWRLALPGVVVYRMAFTLAKFVSVINQNRHRAAVFISSAGPVTSILQTAVCNVVHLRQS